MASARLLIRKGMVDIQGRNRPCIQVQAKVEEKMQALLMEHFATENLFKRSSYAQGLPAGVPVPPPSIAPHLAALIKSDGCPEIAVKTILAGQLQQCQSIWEMMAFEYIAKRAFDALVELMSCASELQTETCYVTPASEQAAFAAEMTADYAAAVEDSLPLISASAA